VAVKVIYLPFELPSDLQRATL